MLQEQKNKSATWFENNQLGQSLYFFWFYIFVVLGIPLIYHHKGICQ